MANSWCKSGPAQLDMNGCQRQPIKYASMLPRFCGEVGNACGDMRMISFRCTKTTRRLKWQCVSINAPGKDAHVRNALSSHHFTPILRFRSHLTITDSYLVIGDRVYEATRMHRSEGSERINSNSNRFK